jgi:hypothetical protein
MRAAWSSPATAEAALDSREKASGTLAGDTPETHQVNGPPDQDFWRLNLRLAVDVLRVTGSSGSARAG